MGDDDNKTRPPSFSALPEAEVQGVSVASPGGRGGRAVARRSPLLGVARGRLLRGTNGVPVTEGPSGVLWKKLRSGHGQGGRGEGDGGGL